MLYEQLKKDLQTARISRNRVDSSLLSTLIGDLSNEEKKGKKLDDNMIIATIKVYVKNINTNIESCKDTNTLLNLQTELATLESYLPKELTHAEIDKLLKDNQLTTIPLAMKFFKTNYPNQYDARYITSQLK